MKMNILGEKQFRQPGEHATVFELPVHQVKGIENLFG